MGTPSMGFQAILLVDASTSINSSSECYEYLDFGLEMDEEIVETGGIRGTRSRPDERTRAGTKRPGGPVRVNCDTGFLDKWFPRILGGTKTGGPSFTYPLTDTLPTGFSVGVSRVAQDHFYSNVSVNRATFRGSAGELLTLELDLQGTNETTLTSGTLTGYAVAEPTNSPFMFFDGAITIGGTTYPIFDFELVIDNMLILDRFMNSQTRAALPAQDRQITIATNNPFTSTEVGLYGTGDTAAVAYVLTFTNGTHIFAFSMANVRYPTKSPNFRGKDEIKLPLQGVARSLGSGGSITRELVTTMTL